MVDIAVIGGGASGIFAAICAAKQASRIYTKSNSPDYKSGELLYTEQPLDGYSQNLRKCEYLIICDESSSYLNSAD